MKLTQDLNIYMRQDENAEEGYTLQVLPAEKSWWAYDDDVKIGSTTVEFDVDLPEPEAMIRLAVETFDEKIVDIMKEAHEQVAKIQKQIKALQFIEHKETV